MPEETRPVWVLGGGGVAGIAWELGILTGLDDEGVHVAPDAVLIGTSAGAVVGAQVAGGTPLLELFERQRGGVAYETSTGLGLGGILQLARAQLFSRSPEQTARRIGRLAIAAESEQRALADPRRLAEARLPVREWTQADLRVVTVDAESGEVRVLTRADGVQLVDAVAASCAVPLTSVPVEIQGRRYIDGGMRSTLNLDLAPGAGPVIALAPSTAAIGPWARIPVQRATLGGGRRVEILYRDAASRHAQGRDVMNPSVVPALVEAGRAQGRREAARVASALATGG